MPKLKAHTHYHAPTKHRFGLWLFWSFLIFLLLAGSFLVWVYRGSESSIRNSVLSAVPFPAAFSGGHIITTSDVFTRFKLAQKSLSSSQKPEATLHRVQDQLVYEARLKTIAAKHGVVVTLADIEAEFNYQKERATKGDSEKFQQLLFQLYKIDEKDFKNTILSPEILLYKLKAWYASKPELNPEATNKLTSIQKSLATEDFGVLAVKYSEDEATRLTKGNVGSIQLGQTLPELATCIKNAQINKPVVCYSRYGLHVIKVLSKQADSQNRPNYVVTLQHIFIQPKDFSVWLANEMQQVPVHNWLNQ